MRGQRVNKSEPDVLELTEMMHAIWKSKDGDHFITVRRHLGVGSDGRDYVSVRDTQTGLPLDELEFRWGISPTDFSEAGRSMNATVAIEEQLIREDRATAPAARYRNLLGSLTFKLR